LIRGKTYWIRGKGDGVIVLHRGRSREAVGGWKESLGTSGESGEGEQAGNEKDLSGKGGGEDSCRGKGEAKNAGRTYTKAD